MSGTGGGGLLGPVPVPPGDPAVLAAGARTYAATAQSMAGLTGRIRAADGEASGTCWAGVGATAFQADTANLAGGYQSAQGALQQGSTALSNYSQDLAASQQAARGAQAAVDQANATAAQQASAQANASAAAAAASQAHSTASQAAATAAAPGAPAGAAQAASQAQAATSGQDAASQAATRQAQALSDALAQDQARAIALTANAETMAQQATVKATAAFEAVAALATAAPPGAGGRAGGGITGNLKSLAPFALAGLQIKNGVTRPLRMYQVTQFAAEARWWRMGLTANEFNVLPTFEKGLVGRNLLNLVTPLATKALPEGSSLVAALGDTSKLAPWMRGGGAGLSAIGTVASAYSTVNQYGWNPVSGYEKGGAHYVAAVANTAFNASSTAFFVAPNPVTAGAVVVSGAVWAGSEIYIHRQAIEHAATDAYNWTTHELSSAVSGGEHLVQSAVHDLNPLNW